MDPTRNDPRDHMTPSERKSFDRLMEQWRTMRRGRIGQISKLKALREAILRATPSEAYGPGEKT